MSTTIQMNPKEYKYLDKYKAAEIVRLSHHTLTKYRQLGKLVEGVHWCYVSSRLVRYSEYRLQEWIAFDYDTKARLRYIERKFGE